MSFLLCPLLSSSVSGNINSLPSPAREPALKIVISIPLSLTFSCPVFLTSHIVSLLWFIWFDAKCPQNILKKKKKCIASLSDDIIRRQLSECKIAKAISWICRIVDIHGSFIWNIACKKEKVLWPSHSYTYMVSHFPPSCHCVVFLNRPSGVVSVFRITYCVIITMRIQICLHMQKPLYCSYT